MTPKTNVYTERVMSVIKVKDTEIQLHPRHNATYYSSLFKELIEIHDARTEAPHDAEVAVLCNLIVLAREFSSPDVHKALVAFKAYIKVAGGVNGIPHIRHHPDLISLRKRTVANMQECIGTELTHYIYPFI